MDSNHRSNLQQIYSLSPLATRESAHYTTYSVVKADDRTRTDNLLITNQLLCQLSHIGTYLKSTKLIYHQPALLSYKNDSYGNRTRVTAVKGRCLNRLTKEPNAAFSRRLETFLLFRLMRTTQTGLEPVTSAVTGRRSNQLSH